MARLLSRLSERLDALETTRTIPTGSGAPTSTPGDGAQYGDKTGGAYYVRLNGVWVPYRHCTAGVDSVVFSASTASADKTVTHGLGFTPIAVIATSQQAGVTMTTKTFGGTTFVAAGFFPSSASGTFPFSWVAYV